MAQTAATWGYAEALTVPALAAEMVDPSWRHADRPLVQFVMDWCRFPDQRRRVLAEEPPAGTDHVVAAKMAAVLHALCERDGLTAPGWVHRHCLDPGIGLFGVPLDSPFGATIRRRAPRTCAEHGVWFGADMLDA